MSGWENLFWLAGPLVAAFAFFVVRGRLRERQGEHQLRRLESRGRASLACRLRGDAPYPGIWEPGRLEVGPDGVEFRPRWRNRQGVRLPAGSVRVLHARLAGPRDGGPRSDNDDLVLLAAADGAETRFQLLVPEERADGAVELLERVGPRPGPSVAVRSAATRPVPSSAGARWLRLAPLWALVIGAQALLGAVVVGGLWAASEPVRAEITGPMDEWEYCPVTWADPWDGSRQTAGLSCYEEEEAAGWMPARALPTPLRGEAFDVESFPMLMVLPALGLLVAGGGIGRHAVALRRGPGQPGPAPVAGNPPVAGPGPGASDAGAGAFDAGPVPELPEVDPDRVDVVTAAAVAAARARRERWRPGRVVELDVADVRGLRWWRVPTLRAVLMTFAGRLLTVSFLVGMGLLGGWTSVNGWLGTQGDVRVVRAEAGVVEGILPVFPAELQVVYPGAEPGPDDEWVWVAVVGDAPTGSVTVVHDATDPSRARLVGPEDGTGRGLLLTGLLVLAGLGWGARAVVGLVGDRRVVLGALHDERTVRLDYVLTCDPEGDAALLLWTDPDASPAFAVPLAEAVLGAVALNGTVEVRGELADGGAVIPLLPGQVLWPASPAVGLDRDDAVLLVTGSLPEEPLRP